MATTSELIAGLSLAVSLTTAGFAYYQWQSTESENRIIAAIDVSKKYSENLGITKNISTWRKSSEKATEEEVRALFFLNYFAYLSNTGRLDRRYLSMTITCDIDDINMRRKFRDEFISKYLTEIEKFSASGRLRTREGV